MEQGADRVLVKDVAALDVLLGARDACLGVRIGQQLEGGFDRLEVLGASSTT